MPTAFHQQLDALTRSIADMCGLAGTAMQHATQALLEVDIVLAETVIRDHQNFVIQAAQAESDAFTLLALQAPVAADLRAVFSSLQNVADVDRMGALALHVAKTARRRHPAHAIPDDVSDYFAEGGESPSTSATTPKMLSCREIPTKQPNSPTKTTPWTKYTAAYSPSS